MTSRDSATVASAAGSTAIVSFGSRVLRSRVQEIACGFQDLGPRVEGLESRVKALKFKV
jgi:outer membrane murein-binding lipoprotein Lpp